MRLLLLPLVVCTALLAPGANAADPVGLWRFGIGSVDGQPAAVGTMVLTGQEIVAGDAAPLRLVCHEAPGITTVLAAGSKGRFAIEADGAGGRLLVLELGEGAVQMDITDKAPYSGIRVRGAALDIQVTGTLFVVERTRRNADYVALVRGKVTVGLRPEVAKALGKAGEIELLEHQGVSGDTTAGVGAPTELSARPQIAFAAGLRAGVAEQGSGASEQGTTWNVDLAAELTGALIEGDDLGDVPGAVSEVVVETTIPFTEMAEDLATSLAELGSSPEPVADQATAGSGSTTTALPPPPPPPPAP